MKFIRKSLMVQLVTYFLLLSVVTVGLVGYITFLRARETLKQAVFDRLETIATLKEDELGRWVGDRREDVLLIATLPEVQSQVEQLLKLEETDAEYQAAYTSLADYLVGVTTRKQDIQGIDLLSAGDGRVILSTDQAHVGDSHADADYFVEGQWGPSIQSVYVSPATGKPTMTIATPLLNEVGRQLGAVLAVHLNLERMDKIVLKQAGLEDSSRTYLVDRSNALVSAERFGEEQEFPQDVHSEGIDAAMQGIDGSGLYPNYEGAPVIGVYRWIGQWDVALLAEMDQQEAFAPAGDLAQVILLVGLILAGVLVAGVYLLARQIARPILTIADTAVQVAAGDLDRVARVEREDEIGVLAQAFNSMTAQLRQFIGTLEKRVAERTRELEQRSVQMEASAQIALEAAAIPDIDRLREEIVRLISERFGFYHAGLFVVDEVSRYAILRAASSEGGRRMLARSHRLRVDEEGVVGYAARRGEPQIALDVGVDAQVFDNPDLPLTRSEAVLPLNVRGRVIGVLDVQSTEEAAFDEDDVAILQTMADQVAVVLENARLLEETEDRLRETRTLLQRESREGWIRLGEERPAWGYVYDGGEVLPGQTAGEATASPGMNVPVQVRDQIIGHLNVALGDRTTTQEDTLLAQAVADQIGQALESARLYQEIQRRASQEQLIGEVTARVRQTLDIDTVLKTTADEIYRALEVDEVLIRLVVDEADERQPGRERT